ncbi:hypothetical protein FRC14_002438 [Serendipita sp. 396]|nr:hypothetical protein FRC14_002438 [Serendipita sp. 396]
MKIDDGMSHYAERRGHVEQNKVLDGVFVIVGKSLKAVVVNPYWDDTGYAQKSELWEYPTIERLPGRLFISHIQT